MDDTFLLFKDKQHVNKFFRYLNSRHKNISFTLEIETDNRLPFLDILVNRKNTFVTNIYRKPTFSGLYSNYHSFLPKKFKSGLIFTLLFRIYTICSDRSKIYTEIGNLRKIMRKNEYPSYFLDNCIKIFFLKMQSEKLTLFLNTMSLERLLIYLLWV